MGRKGKIESSPHYNEIVDLLLTGQSGRYVSDYLQNEYGESISHVALSNFKKNKLNVKAEAKKKIIEKEKKKILKTRKVPEVITKEAKAEISIEAATTYLTRNYERAEKFIEDTKDLDLLGSLEAYKNSPDFDEGKYLDLKIKVQKIQLDYMKYQTDLLEDNTLDVNVSNDNGLFDENEILKIINEESELEEDSNK